MRRILIAGCGYVGVALGERLAAGGDSVFGLRRRVGQLPPPIRPVEADLCNPASLDELPEAPDAVVYTASPAGPSEAAYRAAYREGLGNLLAALDARGERPGRLLFASSTAVYGREDGAWVDESTKAEATHFSGRILLEGEALLAHCGLPTVAVRFGGIYGPGRTRLIEEVRAGRGGEPPGPERYTNRIHRDDAAGVLAHLLSLPDPDPLYLGVDCEPASRREVVQWLARQLGRPAPGAASSGGPPSPRARSSKRCRNRRILAAGYRFLYPSFREGYGALLGA